MALKDIFTMVKADRYTADGREALIKAQEAETEDKVYQIGEISQKTGLQKTATGWVKPKSGKAAGAKTGEGKSPSAGSINRTPERIKKETAIMEALNLSTGEDNNLHKMSDETIERLYKKAMSDTPAAESKPAANVKRNESEAVKNGDKTIYRIKGTQYYFDSPEEAESAILAENRSGETYAKPSKDENINNIQEALGFKLDMTSGNSMDEFIKKTGENEYAANVWSFGRDSKGTLINKLSETSSPNATIKKENGEWKLYHKDRDGKETIVTANGRQDPTESKPAAASDIPDFKGMTSEDFDKKLRSEGWTTGGWEGSETHSSAIFKKGNRTIRVNEGQPGKITSIQEISKDSAPRVLTGDTKIRVKKA